MRAQALDEGTSQTSASEAKPSRHLRVSYGEATCAGPRSENQDAIRVVIPADGLVATKGLLFAVADGVSGCADGRLAAHATVQSVATDYYATPETWTVSQSLERLLGAQNRWLRGHSAEGGLLTTLTTLVLRGRRLTVAHVGDCRAYRWGPDGLQQLTQDHVWRQPGMEHVLTRAMGLEAHLVVDYQEETLIEGEGFVLLSDGVWAVLDEAVIADVMASETDLTSKARLLVDAAGVAGSQDNASAIVLRIEAVPDDPWAAADVLPLPPQLHAGQSIDGWQVLEALGESRQSLRYRVTDAHGQRWLLKTLPASRADDLDAMQALSMEAWFLRRVSGRAFAQTPAAGHSSYLYYVQREYEGRTLAEQLAEEGPLGLSEWFDCATRLLKAVGQLHRRNLVHRDIKPENLHRGHDGELRLLDFGLVYCPGLSQTDDGLAGTPTYIAPERYRGEPPTAGHDLFAVGITLYRLLTGHYPYGELEPFQRPHFGPPSSCLRHRADAPPWLDAWLCRCIEVEPARRFETAEEALLELEKGERRALAGPRPLMQREPLKTWQAIAALSLCGNLVVLVWLLYSFGR
ncbi:protein kinase domain-containing protein [Pseudomonas sp. Marseille-QA0892]